MPAVPAMTASMSATVLGTLVSTRQPLDVITTSSCQQVPANHTIGSRIQQFPRYELHRHPADSSASP
eukprot:5469034-Amphidinium_carterae.1